MTNNAFSGTLNPTQSINLCQRSCSTKVIAPTHVYTHTGSIALPRPLPCPCSPMVKPLGRHVQSTFAVAEDRFEPRPGRARLLKKNYFK